MIRKLNYSIGLIATRSSAWKIESFRILIVNDFSNFSILLYKITTLNLCQHSIYYLLDF